MVEIEYRGSICEIVSLCRLRLYVSEITSRLDSIAALAELGDFVDLPIKTHHRYLFALDELRKKMNSHSSHAVGWLLSIFQGA